MNEENKKEERVHKEAYIDILKRFFGSEKGRVDIELDKAEMNIKKLQIKKSVCFWFIDDIAEKVKQTLSIMMTLKQEWWDVTLEECIEEYRSFVEVSHGNGKWTPAEYKWLTTYCDMMEACCQYVREYHKKWWFSLKDWTEIKI